VCGDAFPPKENLIKPFPDTHLNGSTRQYSFIGYLGLKGLWKIQLRIEPRFLGCLACNIVTMVRCGLLRSKIILIIYMQQFFREPRESHSAP
jgi:hypothetical protein